MRGARQVTIVHASGGWLPSRARRLPATGVILHATGGETSGGAIGWLRRIGLSYHYVIAKDGTVTKAVPLSRVAYHAGRSVGWAGPDCNEYTIGVSLVNRNDGKDPYTQEQLQSLTALLQRLRDVDPRIRHLSAHRIVSPGRKTDPRNLSLRAIAPSGYVLWLG